MIFCNTKEEVRLVYTFLAGKGLPTAMLSSDLPQRKRESVMARFRSGEIRHLVTTDVASRGIDIEDLSHVFIFSTPDSPEQYIHRAGRTGRVGKSGRAISLLSAHDLMNFNRQVKRYKIEVREITVPSDEEVQERKVERIVTRLAAEGQTLPLEDYAEFSPIAQRVAEHEHRDRIVAAAPAQVLPARAGGRPAGGRSGAAKGAPPSPRPPRTTAGRGGPGAARPPRSPPQPSRPRGR
jgi:ATP-dependent RNA helicase DeaD